MRVEVIGHYGLTQPVTQQPTLSNLSRISVARLKKVALVAVCGVVGSGKTVTLRRLQQPLSEEKKVIVARSLSVEKQNI